MTPSFEYYRVFYYVAKYRSFTLAAKVLLTSQPSVTRSIQNLEHDLGCRLLTRSKRSVRLTAEGRLLYGYISSACALIFTGEEAVRDVVLFRGGSVSIGATETAVRCFLLEKLEAFHRAFPQIHIKITGASTGAVLAGLREGKTELAVVTTPLGEEEGLRVDRVRPVEELLAGGRSFAALQARELTLAELREYPLVCLSEETMSGRFYADLFAREGLRLQADIELATADLLLPIIEKGLGIGFIPAAMAEEALEEGRVVRLRLREKIPPRYICVVQDPEHPPGAPAGELAKLLLT